MNTNFIDEMRAAGCTGKIVERTDEPNWIAGMEVEVVNKFAGEEIRSLLQQGDIIYDRFYKRHYICQGFYLNDDELFVQFIVGHNTKNKYDAPIPSTTIAMKVKTFQNSCDGGAYGRRGYFEWMRKN